MTTVLSDAKLGVMVADSMYSDGERAASMRKVWRVNGELVGLAGTVAEFAPFVDWYRQGMMDEAPPMKSVIALILSDRGLTLFTGGDRKMTPVQGGRDAIGTGGMAAMAAHEALGFADPKRAVQLACKHDAKSRPPVRVYHL